MFIYVQNTEKENEHNDLLKFILCIVVLHLNRNLLLKIWQ